MAKKKTKTAPLHATEQEMSTMQIWLWIIGGMLLLAIVFAFIEVLSARFFG